MRLCSCGSMDTWFTSGPSSAHQGTVLPAQLQQFLMCSPLHHLTLIQDNDLITIPDGGEAVGNDDQGDALRFHRLHDQVLRLGIQGTGGLIQDQDGGPLGQGPGNLQALSLAPREVLAPFFNHMGVASRPSHDVFVNLGIFAGFDHGGFINGLVPQGEVVEDGVFKERYVLIHHRDGGGKNLAGNLLPGDAVEKDLTRPGLVEPRDELTNGGLTASGGAHQGDAAPWFDREGETLDEGRCRFVVAKGDAPQFPPLSLSRGSVKLGSSSSTSGW